MFTDIEGSTRLVHELGDDYAETLDLHNRLLREAFARHGGVVVVTTGDGFFVAFAEAAGALSAALDAQRAITSQAWPQGTAVAVRMGLHTGEPTIVEGDYVGLDVHRAARISAAAHGGQIVMSAATHELVARSVEVKDLGTHHLKGLDEAERIHQVLAPGLRADFPPLASLSAPTNIPNRIDPIVGRSNEIEELRHLLTTGGKRLVTIHGPGGAGKTRLAVHVAAGSLEHFTDGTFFVDLTPVAGGGVESAIAEVLGLSVENDVGGLGDAIGSKEMLLVLDNFEQAIDAAQWVSGMVQACPRLRVLVTSQVVLRVRGEHEFQLPPLPLPTDESLEAVLASDAALLFAERASAAHPGFEIDQGNARAISHICRMLDGLPLALELAAARMRLFSVEQLSTRLEGSLGVLAAGSRDAPSRHQTLRAAVDWSYGLLTPTEQVFFRDFAVFNGGADLLAVEAVVAAEDGDLDPLVSLVEHSLIRRSETDADIRFSMLQTIRSFALELLGSDPDQAKVRQRHATFYLELATSVQEDREEVIEREVDNCRDALEWWLDPAGSDGDGAGTSALRLADALGTFWYRHGHAVEGIAWFERALVAANDPPPELRATALRRLGILVEATRDLERSRSLFEEALERFRAAGSQEGEAACLNSLGVVMRSLGDLDQAETFFERAADLRRALGDEAGLSTTISNLGIIATDRGDLARAEELFEISLSIDTKLGDEWGQMVDANNLAIVHFERGDPVLATTMTARALTGFAESGDLDGVAESLELSAGIAGARDDPVRAARLAGAADALRAAAGLPLAPPDRERFDRWMDAPRAALSPADFEAHWGEGAAMTPQQATDFALRPSDGPDNE